jgi:fermentation-respiration switch protein FrsA (DUF1100 family)
MSNYPLRLPDSLNDQARQRAEAMGLSLNSFICMAVEVYFQQGDPEVSPSVLHEAEGQAAHAPAVERPVPKWATEDPKPVLGPKPTRRQRRALASWYERKRLRGGEFAIPDVG